VLNNTWFFVALQTGNFVSFSDMQTIAATFAIVHEIAQEIKIELQLKQQQCIINL